ncbi:hypothetical protein Scep_002146 [Stephania cephalantha]|uniref:Uncharacterized protein n=1 Tax=Stephania cephalantha TaxID=152367 RepID=A0AAP0LAG5_9MAGN
MDTRDLGVGCRCARIETHGDVLRFAISRGCCPGIYRWEETEMVCSLLGGLGGAHRRGGAQTCRGGARPTSKMGYGFGPHGLGEIVRKRTRKARERGDPASKEARRAHEEPAASSGDDGESALQPGKQP